MRYEEVPVFFLALGIAEVLTLIVMIIYEMFFMKRGFNKFNLLMFLMMIFISGHSITTYVRNLVPPGPMQVFWSKLSLVVGVLQISTYSFYMFVRTHKIFIASKWKSLYSKYATYSISFVGLLSAIIQYFSGTIGLLLVILQGFILTVTECFYVYSFRQNIKALEIATGKKASEIDIISR
jgi:hypothetical protein